MLWSLGEIYRRLRNGVNFPVGIGGAVIKVYSKKFLSLYYAGLSELMNLLRCRVIFKTFIQHFNQKGAIQKNRYFFSHYFPHHEIKKPLSHFRLRAYERGGYSYLIPQFQHG